MTGGSDSIAVVHDESWWARLRYTPLRDVVRGRVTGRLDLRGLVVRSRLPDALQAHVLDVVRRTRLWRLERMDVATELIAHFADGLEAGRAPEALTSDFGDVRRAARLIRRGKKRVRPAAWRYAMQASRAGGVVLAVLLVIYLVLAARLWLGRPDIAHDYLADVNAPVRALDESQRAWPLYRQAMLALPPAPLVYMRAEPRPGAAGWEDIVGYLEENAAIVERVREAAARPGLGYEYGFGTLEADEALFGPSSSNLDNAGAGLYGVLLPHLSKLRGLAGVVRADAYCAAERGDGATVIANVEALQGMARQACAGAFIIDQLVGLSIARTGVDVAGVAVAEWPDAFTDAQFRDLAHVLDAGAADDGAWRVDLAGERLGFDDVLQRVYTDDGDGDGRLTATGFEFLQRWGSSTSDLVHDDQAAMLLMPAIGAIDAGRHAMREEYNRLLGLLQEHRAQPLWERGPDPIDTELEAMMAEPIAVIRYHMVAIFLPAIGKTDITSVKLNFARDSVQAAIAATLHRRQTGAWPTSLDALVPGLLPAVPIDIFDGHPLKYRLHEGRPLIYSCGSDRDDDLASGATIPNRPVDPWRMSVWYPPGELEKARDGDWVLWPPEPPAPGGRSPDDEGRPAWEFRARLSG